MDKEQQIAAAVSALNTAFKQDPKAIWTLMNTYTPCNEELANHPTVQVIEKDVEGQSKFTVGPLGLLNGVLEAALGQRVCIMTSEPNQHGQRMLLGFDIYTPPDEKRTEEALILARLSGLAAKEATETLTAAVNAFNGQSLNEKQIINKMAAVDASFAVSSRDLAEALTRAGEKAEAAKVSFDELIAVVTAVQQKTARGGGVIGNALKTIFERFNRAKTKGLLKDLGVALVKDGEPRAFLDVLPDIAKLEPSKKKDEFLEELGGTYHSTILLSLLRDIQSEESVYKKALGSSKDASDEAYRRNEALDQTQVV